MTSPGQYAAQDGSFARSAGGAAGRGIVLIVIAVAIGLVLLAKGFDGGGTDLAAGNEPAGEPSDDTTGEPADDTTGEPSDDTTGEPSDDTTGEPADDTPVENPDEPRPPGEVRVAAVNATGLPGLAGTATGILDTQGYVTAAKNGSIVPTETSAILYVAGYAEDAKAIASILSIPADLIGPAQSNVVELVANNDNVANFHVFVIQGTDGLAGQ